MLALMLFSLAGSWDPLELWLMEARMRVVDRPASGELVVVQIDARTLERTVVWPFPRAFHAQVIENLLSAGAAQIALDVDLSDSRDGADTKRFARALEKADGQIILPLFYQSETTGQAGGDLVVSRPLPAFADHAWLANVNVLPDPDGNVRRSNYGAEINGHFYPSMAALLAGRASRQGATFYIDFGVNPGTVPRLSYSDILEGEFDPGVVRGKSVIIGATAIELGDQLTVPVRGVVSGPVIQALTFETIKANREVRRTSLAITLFGVFVLSLLSHWSYSRLSWQAMIAGMFCLVAGLEVVGFMLFSTAATNVDTIAWSFTVFAFGARGLIGVLEDQRQQIGKQRLETRRRRKLMASVMADSFDGIVITNDAGVIEVINLRALSVLDLSGVQAENPEVLEGMQLREILPPSLSVAVALCDEGVLQEVALDEEGRGETQYVEFVHTMSWAPEPGTSLDDVLNQRMHTYTFRDVTERRRAQEAIARAHQEEAAANRSKSEFLANMSHELRTPLNAIIGFSELMSQQLLGPIGNDQYVGYVTDIYDSGQHLLEIVNDVLDVARISSGDMVLHEDDIDVADCLKSSLRIAQGWALTAGRQFHLEIAPGVEKLYADPRLVKQMVLNLLSNAVKFTTDDGEIRLRAMQVEGGELEISVSDDGVGIPGEELPFLGQPFYQVSSSLERTHEGTGLGLSLVKLLIEAHEGDFKIQSTFGEGTCVTLSFPRNRVPLGETGDEAAWQRP